MKIVVDTNVLLNAILPKSGNYWLLYVVSCYIWVRRTNAMIIEINRNTKPETLKEMLKKAPRKTTIRKFVGKLKRGLDGLAYQNEARHEWH